MVFMVCLTANSSIMLCEKKPSINTTDMTLKSRGIWWKKKNLEVNCQVLLQLESMQKLSDKESFSRFSALFKKMVGIFILKILKFRHHKFFINFFPWTYLKKVAVYDITKTEKLPIFTFLIKAFFPIWQKF